TDNPVDLVAVLQEQFGEVTAVLTGDPGDQCPLHRRPFVRLRGPVPPAQPRPDSTGLFPTGLNDQPPEPQTKKAHPGPWVGFRQAVRVVTFSWARSAGGRTGSPRAPGARRYKPRGRPARPGRT